MARNIFTISNLVDGLNYICLQLSLAWHNLMYVVLMVLLGFHAAGWAIYGRVDLCVWDALAAAACLVNVFLIDKRSYGERIRSRQGKMYR